MTAETYEKARAALANEIYLQGEGGGLTGAFVRAADARIKALEDFVEKIQRVLRCGYPSQQITALENLEDEAARLLEGKTND